MDNLEWTPRRDFRQPEPADAEYSLTRWLRICDRMRDAGMLGAPMDGLHYQGLLADGGVVAVIGGRRSNVPDYWDHPQCVFLSGENVVRRGLPRDCRAVLFTRWVGHVSFAYALKLARKRGVPSSPVLGTGQLKVILASLFQQPVAALHSHQLPPMTDEFTPPDASEPELADLLDATAPTPEPEPEPEPAAPPLDAAPPTPTPEDDTMTKKAPPLQRGEVTQWVRKQYSPGFKFADLLRLAAQEQVPYKESALSAAFYAIKRGVQPLPPAKPKGKGKVSAALFPAVAQSNNGASGSSDDLVRLIDDAIAGLHLVREAAVKASADREKMAQIFKLAQQLQSS